MKRTLLLSLLLLLALFANVASGATYYIDYTAADDSANGTTTSTPWKRAPGMTGFAGSYAHSAGDQFIFKGGVVWSNACFQWVISGSGTSGSRDYYGVSAAYYTGGSWTQPVLDFSGATVATARIYSTADYITLDNFEMRGHAATSGTNYVGSSTVWLSGLSTDFTRNYVHGWSYADSKLGNDYMIVMTGNAVSNRIDGSESLIGGKGSGRALTSARVFRGNVITNVVNGILTSGSYADGIVESNLVSGIVEAIDAVEHGNAIYVFGGTTINGNTIRDVFGGYQTLYVETSSGSVNNTNLIFNNLIFNPGSGCIVMESDLGTGTNSDTRIYNNTLVGGASHPAFRVTPRATHPRYIAMTNNQFICDGAPLLYNGANGVIDVFECGNNLTNTVSAATSAGYTAGNLYQPTSESSLTVDVGVNLSSIFTTNKLGATRSAPWDIGAYEWSSGGEDPPEDPPATITTLRVGTLILR